LYFYVIAGNVVTNAGKPVLTNRNAGNPQLDAWEMAGLH